MAMSCMSRHWLGEARHVGPADVAHIHALEHNGQGHGWPGRTGDSGIPSVTGALLLEKQRKGGCWG